MCLAIKRQQQSTGQFIRFLEWKDYFLIWKMTVHTWTAKGSIFVVKTKLFHIRWFFKLNWYWFKYKCVAWKLDELEVWWTHRCYLLHVIFFCKEAPVEKMTCKRWYMSFHAMYRYTAMFNSKYCRFKKNNTQFSLSSFVAHLIFQNCVSDKKHINVIVFFGWGIIYTTLLNSLVILQ